MYIRFKKGKGKERDASASWYVSLAQSDRRTGEQCLAYLGTLNPKAPLDGQLKQLVITLTKATQKLAIHGPAAEKLFEELTRKSEKRHAQGSTALDCLPLEPIPPFVLEKLENARKAGVPEEAIQARIREFRKRPRLPWQASLGI